ncbi:MAG: hypothetical protein ACQEXG_14780 [Pseudomonadota bacterium]
MADPQAQTVTIDGEQDNAAELSEHARHQGVNLRVTDEEIQHRAQAHRPDGPHRLCSGAGQGTARGGAVMRVGTIVALGLALGGCVPFVPVI